MRQLGQWGLTGAQADQCRTGLADQGCGVQQVLGASGLGNGDRHILRAQGHGRHGLHVRIGIGRSGDLQAEELVLGVTGHRTRGAEAIEFHPPRVAQCLDGPFQPDRIQAFTHIHQRRQGGVEDLVGQLAYAVVLADGELPEAGARSQTLSQAQFQILEAGAADGAAEADDGGLADAHFPGQIRHRGVHDISRMGEHMIGHLEFGFAQLRAAGGNVLEQVHVGFMRWLRGRLRILIGAVL